jgi:hypothetical protein
MGQLKLTDDEFNWAVKNIPYIPIYFWEWLKSFRFAFDKVKAYLDEESHIQFSVFDRIALSTLYEVPCLRWHQAFETVAIIAL